MASSSNGLTVTCLTGIKVIIARFVPERVKRFSTVAAAGLVKTRYGLTAFIDVVL